MLNALFDRFISLSQCLKRYLSICKFGHVIQNVCIKDYLREDNLIGTFIDVIPLLLKTFWRMQRVHLYKISFLIQEYHKHVLNY